MELCRVTLRQLTEAMRAASEKTYISAPADKPANRSRSPRRPAPVPAAEGAQPVNKEPMPDQENPA
eukprot:9192037-Karenia_brevis.AAC.1